MRRPIALGGFLFVCLGLGAVSSEPPAPDTGDECTGKTYESEAPGNAMLDCENPCTAWCQSEVVTTPFGDGAVCSCTVGGFDGCCTIALVPPSGDGAGVAHGDCDTNNCPDPGTCQNVLVITSEVPLEWTFTASCFE